MIEFGWGNGHDITHRKSTRPVRDTGFLDSKVAGALQNSI